jgi:hypothetical protein
LEQGHQQSSQKNWQRALHVMNPDQVIEMLADRAAIDQDLKALMRIVADGKAAKEELQKFQGFYR